LIFSVSFEYLVYSVSHSNGKNEGEIKFILVT
jgi:hypothetical protein